MDEVVLRHLLQTRGQSLRNDTDSTVPNATIENFETAVVVVIMMAVGSCCLVTCCNCVRLGASIFFGGTYVEAIHSEQRERRPAAERARIVKHEWDASNPDDPVFVILPDGGINLAYTDQEAPAAAAKTKPDAAPPAAPEASAARREASTLWDRILVRRAGRGTVGGAAALRAAASIEAAAPSRHSSMEPSERGSMSMRRRASTDSRSGRDASASRRLRQTRSASAAGRREERRAAQRRRHRARRNAARTPAEREARARARAARPARLVDYCSIALDNAVLEESLAASAAAYEASGSGRDPRHSAVAFLLEQSDADSSDDDDDDDDDAFLSMPKAVSASASLSLVALSEGSLPIAPQPQATSLARVSATAAQQPTAAAASEEQETARVAATTTPRPVAEASAASVQQRGGASPRAGASSQQQQSAEAHRPEGNAAHEAVAAPESVAVDVPVAASVFQTCPEVQAADLQPDGGSAAAAAAQ